MLWLSTTYTDNIFKQNKIKLNGINLKVLFTDLQKIHMLKKFGSRNWCTKVLLNNCQCLLST